MRLRGRRRVRGIMTFDLLAGLSLVILVLAGFGLAAHRLAAVQKLTVMQRQVRDAAVCVLDSIRTGAGDPQGVVRESGATYAAQIEVHIRREPGLGDWAGATRVTVEAVLDRGEQPAVRAVLSTYVFEAEAGS